MSSKSKCVHLALALCALNGCVSHAGKSDAPQPAPIYTTFTVERDIVYSPAGWPNALHADVYVPEGTGPFPGILMVHGGGWDARDRSDMDSTSAKLANRGYVVANVDYRLAPQFLYPASLEDMYAALHWMRANAVHLKLDPAHIGGWGYSAGAHLVALAATRARQPEQRLQAVVAGGLPSDLPHYPVSPIIIKYIGASFAEKSDVWKQASPLLNVSADSPPMFIYHGLWDRLVSPDDGIVMYNALREKNVTAELYLIRGSGHITTFLFGFGAESAGIEFLDRQLR